MRKPGTNEKQKQIANFLEYFENKRIRESATFCYRPSGSYYIFKRKEIRRDHFECLYPIELIRADNGKGLPVSKHQI